MTFLQLKMNNESNVTIQVEKLITYFPHKDEKCMLEMVNGESFSVMHTYAEINQIIKGIYGANFLSAL